MFDERDNVEVRTKKERKIEHRTSNNSNNSNNKKNNIESYIEKEMNNDRISTCV